MFTIGGPVLTIGVIQHSFHKLVTNCDQWVGIIYYQQEYTGTAIHTIVLCGKNISKAYSLYQ